MSPTRGTYRRGSTVGRVVVGQPTTTRTVAREDGYYPPAWIATERDLYARRARSITWQPSILVWLAGCAGVLVGATVMYVATWNLPRPDPAPCIPASAVDYDGQADEWIDGAGRPVLHAIEEDQYPWCPTTEKGK